MIRKKNFSLPGKMFIFSILFTCMPLAASEYNLSYFSDTLGSTDIAALKAVLIDDLKQASVASGGFVTHRWGFSYDFNDKWKFIIAERAIGTVETNANTVESYYYISKNKNISNDPLDVFVRYQLLHAKGFGLSYAEAIGDLNFKIDLHHWNVQEFRDSFAYGNVRGTRKGSIRGTVDFVEYYSDKNFLKRPKKEGAWQNDGRGLSIDINLNYNFTQNLKLYVDAKDLISQINFKNIGYTFGKISSENSFIDNSGNLSFLPVLSGMETESNLEYKIPRFTKVGFLWSMNSLWQLGTEFNYNQTLPLYQLNLTRSFGAHHVGAWINPRYKTPGIHWRYNKWMVNFGIDKVDTNKAKNFYLAVQAPFSF